MRFVVPAIMLLLASATAFAPTAHAASHPIEVKFESDISLVGSLVLPEGEGPFPAVVFVHGSGPMTREGFSSYAEDFARMGIASLSFDKRGAGLSGKGPEALDRMAQDILSAVRHIEKRDDIDTERVGFWGISQAGWVITRAMAISHAPDFAIVVSGGGASPLESELFSWDREFEKYGLEGDDLEAARAFVRDYYSYFGGALSHDELLANFAEAKDSEGPLALLAEFLEPRIVPEEERHLAAWVHDYDPAPDIALIDEPVLVMMGDKDTDHPAALAMEAWKTGLEAAGNHQSTLVTFAGAGHGIRMREGHEGEGPAPFADGYRELIDGWLWRHVVTAK